MVVMPHHLDKAGSLPGATGMPAHAVPPAPSPRSALCCTDPVWFHSISKPSAVARLGRHFWVPFPVGKRLLC